MANSTNDIHDIEELTSLMNEFPEWRRQFPEIYDQLNPVRYDKQKNHLKKMKPPTTEKVYKDDRPFPLTDYQETYVEKRGVRMRSSKRPPPSPRDRHPPPMMFETHHRSVFVEKTLPRGRKLYTEPKSLEPPSEPFNGMTCYQEEYKSKPLPLITNTRRQANTVPGSIAIQPGKFSSETTFEEHYKRWNSRPAITFREPPSFADSLIYPGRKRRFVTTNQRTFRCPDIRRPTMSNEILATNLTGYLMQQNNNTRSDLTLASKADPTQHTSDQQKSGTSAESAQKMDARVLPSLTKQQGSARLSDMIGGIINQQSTEPKQASAVAKGYRPDLRSTPLMGSHDFNTIYRLEFRKPFIVRNLMKSQQMALIEELRKRKEEKLHNDVTTISGGLSTGDCKRVVELQVHQH